MQREENFQEHSQELRSKSYLDGCQNRRVIQQARPFYISDRRQTVHSYLGKGVTTRFRQTI